MKAQDATAIRELTAAELEAVSGGVINEGCSTLVAAVNSVAGAIGAYTTAAATTGPKAMRALGIDPWA